MRGRCTCRRRRRVAARAVGGLRRVELRHGRLRVRHALEELRAREALLLRRLLLAHGRESFPEREVAALLRRVARAVARLPRAAHGVPPPRFVDRERLRRADAARGRRLRLARRRVVRRVAEVHAVARAAAALELLAAWAGRRALGRAPRAAERDRGVLELVAGHARRHGGLLYVVHGA